MPHPIRVTLIAKSVVFPKHTSLLTMTTPQGIRDYLAPDRHQKVAPIYISQSVHLQPLESMGACRRLKKRLSTLAKFAN